MRHLLFCERPREASGARGVPRPFPRNTNLSGARSRRAKRLDSHLRLASFASKKALIFPRGMRDTRKAWTRIFADFRGYTNSLGSRIWASTRTVAIRENPRTIREHPRPRFFGTDTAKRVPSSPESRAISAAVSSGSVGSADRCSLTEPLHTPHCSTDGSRRPSPRAERCKDDNVPRPAEQQILRCAQDNSAPRYRLTNRIFRTRPASTENALAAPPALGRSKCSVNPPPARNVSVETGVSVCAGT